MSDPLSVIKLLIGEHYNNPRKREHSHTQRTLNTSRRSSVPTFYFDTFYFDFILHLLRLDSFSDFLLVFPLGEFFGLYSQLCCFQLAFLWSSWCLGFRFPHWKSLHFLPQSPVSLVRRRCTQLLSVTSFVILRDGIEIDFPARMFNAKNQKRDLIEWNTRHFRDRREKFSGPPRV
jgi:hypothetical protein